MYNNLALNNAQSLLATQAHNFERVRKFLNREQIYRRLKIAISMLIPHRSDVKLILNIGGGSYTDDKVIVIGLPECFMNLSFEEMLIALRALVGHECQHINSSVFAVFSDFINEMADYLFTKHKVPLRDGKKIAKHISNSVEDGRIEKILGNKWPGYIRHLKLLNGTIWENQPVRGKSELGDFLYTITTYSVTGLYPKGYKELYEGTELDANFNKIKDDILDGINALTCLQCMNICREILHKVEEYIVKLIGNKSEEDQQFMSNNIPQNPEFTSNDEKDTNSNRSQSTHFKPEMKQNEESEEGEGGEGDSEEKNDDKNESSGKSGSGKKKGKNKKKDDSKSEDGGSDGSDEEDEKENQGKKSSSNGEDDKDQSGEDNEEDSSDGNGSGDSEDDAEQTESKDSSSGDGDENDDEAAGEDEGDSSEDGGSEGEDGDEDGEGSDSSGDGDDENGDDDSDKNGDDSKSSNGGSDDDGDDDGDEGNSSEASSSGSSKSDTDSGDDDSGELDEDLVRRIIEELSESAIEEARRELEETAVVKKPKKDDEKKLTPEDIKELADKYKGERVRNLREMSGFPTIHELPVDLKTDGLRFKREVQRIFQNKEAMTFRNQKKGILDVNNLYRVGMREYNVFTQKGVPSKSDWVAYLLKDGSGSMSSDNKELYSCAACAILEEGLKGVIPFKTTVFDVSGGYVRHYTIKDFNEVNPSRNLAWNFYKERREKNGIGGGNKDGYSIRVATKELEKRPESSKILVILSDGMPSDYDGGFQEGMLDVRNAVAEARRKGILVVAVMFGSQDFRDAYIENYRAMYEKNIISCDPSQISSYLISLFKRIISR